MDLTGPDLIAAIVAAPTLEAATQILVDAGVEDPTLAAWEAGVHRGSGGDAVELETETDAGPV